MLFRQPLLPVTNSMLSDTVTTEVGLEPVLHNEQLYRYLQALNETKGINEGDDK